jgi:hypothetical protein
MPQKWTTLAKCTSCHSLVCWLLVLCFFCCVLVPKHPPWVFVQGLNCCDCDRVVIAICQLARSNWINVSLYDLPSSSTPFTSIDCCLNSALTTFPASLPWFSLFPTPWHSHLSRNRFPDDRSSYTTTRPATVLFCRSYTKITRHHHV